MVVVTRVTAGGCVDPCDAGRDIDGDVARDVAGTGTVEGAPAGASFVKIDDVGGEVLVSIRDGVEGARLLVGAAGENEPRHPLPSGVSTAKTTLTIPVTPATLVQCPSATLRRPTVQQF